MAYVTYRDLKPGDKVRIADKKYTNLENNKIYTVASTWEGGPFMEFDGLLTRWGTMIMERAYTPKDLMRDCEVL